jgi:tetratricopeptide (TPR) repeat protein
MHSANDPFRVGEAAREKWRTAEVLDVLGEAAEWLGNPRQAVSFYSRSLMLYRRLGDRAGAGLALDHLAKAARQRGQYDRAARLLAAARKSFEEVAAHAPAGSLASPAEREQEMTAVRAALGETAFGSAWAAGRAMTLDEATEFALRDDA